MGIMPIRFKKTFVSEKDKKILLYFLTKQAVIGLLKRTFVFWKCKMCHYYHERCNKQVLR